MIVELSFNVLVYICQVGMESEGFAIYDAMMRMKAEVLYIYYLQLISSILIIWYRVSCTKNLLENFYCLRRTYSTFLRKVLPCIRYWSFVVSCLVEISSSLVGSLLIICLSWLEHAKMN
jgi:hypothetical protein